MYILKFSAIAHSDKQTIYLNYVCFDIKLNQITELLL